MERTDILKYSWCVHMTGSLALLNPVALADCGISGRGIGGQKISMKAAVSSTRETSC